MTQMTREFAATAANEQTGSSSLGHEYHLQAPLDSDFAELGTLPPSEFQALEASDVQARAQWRRTLLAVRRALGNRY